MVAAYNGGGQGPASNVASITPVGLPEAPVRIFSSSAAGGMITLDYSVNPSVERPITGGSVTLTSIEDSDDTATASLSLDGSTATAEFSAGELIIGVDHDVTVTLTNAAGSTVITDEPDVLPIDLPNAPAGFSGEMTNTEGGLLDGREPGHRVPCLRLRRQPRRVRAGLPRSGDDHNDRRTHARCDGQVHGLHVRCSR